MAAPANKAAEVIAKTRARVYVGGIVAGGGGGGGGALWSPTVGRDDDHIGGRGTDSEALAKAKQRSSGDMP